MLKAVESLFPALLIASIGFVGVLIGGIIASVTACVVESTRAARERQREQRTRVGSLRLAARIVYAELADAQSCAEFTLQEKRWPEGLRGETKDWETYRTILATELPGEEWVALMRSIISIQTLNQVRTIATDQNGKLFESPLTVISQVRSNLENGRKILEPYCQG